MPLRPVPPPRSAVDFTARREACERAVRAAAEAPVRHVPAALLDALQGSWGTPAEVLRAAARPSRPAVAR